jgi:hypothetical protein
MAYGSNKRLAKCVRSSRTRGSENFSDRFVFEGLEERGRLQFFFHSHSSELHIRDVLNEQKRGYKTEPHIEIGAENYIFCCYQSNNIMNLRRILSLQ